MMLVMLMVQVSEGSLVLDHWMISLIHTPLIQTHQHTHSRQILKDRLYRNAVKIALPFNLLNIITEHHQNYSKACYP